MTKNAPAHDDESTADQPSILRSILDEWSEAIRIHDMDRVSALFTEDAVFQGSDPTYSIGPNGVAAYYSKRPVGLTPRYTVREIRSLGPAAFSAYVDVDFVHPSGKIDPSHLALVLLNESPWRIKQYHVARVM